MMIYNLLQSMQLLGDAAVGLHRQLRRGIEADEERISEADVGKPDAGHGAGAEIGYDNATKVAKTAHKNGTTLKEEAVRLGFVDEETFDRIVQPQDMLGPK